MCTLSFVPLSNNEYVLTSNRDEQPERETIPPAEYKHDDKILIYPKDKRAGGTWIGTNKKGRVASLMNGGKVPHKRKESYRLSRGVVMTELLKTENVDVFLKTFDFRGIEPFTIILIEPLNVPHHISDSPSFQGYELIWDEIQLHVRKLDWKPQIWSSTPLYTREVHQIRTAWFNEFIENTPILNPEAIWEFHHTAGNGDKTMDLIMDRGVVHTKSVTQIIQKEKVEIQYNDKLR